jgi:hypothetical protein
MNIECYSYGRSYDLKLQEINFWKKTFIKSQYVEVPRDQIRNVELKTSSYDNICAISTVVENNNFNLILTNQDFCDR